MHEMSYEDHKTAQLYDWMRHLHHFSSKSGKNMLGDIYTPRALKG